MVTDRAVPRGYVDVLSGRQCEHPPVWENLNACGDYSMGDLGIPSTPNRAYYVTEDSIQIAIPCAGGGVPKQSVRVYYRVGSWTSAPVNTGSLPVTGVHHPQAVTEAVAQNRVAHPQVQPQYFGLDHGSSVNDSYGLSLYTVSGWKSWTDANFGASNTAVVQNNPYQYTQFVAGDHGHFWTDDV